MLVCVGSPIVVAKVPKTEIFQLLIMLYPARFGRLLAVTPVTCDYTGTPYQ